MAQQALGPGRSCRASARSSACSTPTAGRWARLKAFVWLVVIILMLGYIPDRAYYFTVNRTIDLGVLAWSPINLCPPENESLPCPAPVGAVVPWHASPPELALPAARTDGAVVQVGHEAPVHRRLRRHDGAVRRLRRADRPAPATSTRGPTGPTLPEPRADAGVVYVARQRSTSIGGFDADGKPTDDGLTS